MSKKRKNEGNKRTAKDRFPRLRQLEIIHVSDLHFGDNHQFDPDLSTTGDALSKKGIRCLADSMIADVSEQLEFAIDHDGDEEDSLEEDVPLIACLTGDFAEKGKFEEFELAHTYIKSLSGAPWLRAGTRNVFTVPGNHDVTYDKADVVQRFQQYIAFHNQVHGDKLSIREVGKLDKVHDRIDDLGAVIVTINSSGFVEKGTPDEQRGQLRTCLQIACWVANRRDMRAIMDKWIMVSLDSVVRS
jgi:hypothetical protein